MGIGYEIEREAELHGDNIVEWIQTVPANYNVLTIFCRSTVMEHLLLRVDEIQKAYAGIVY